MVSSIRSGVFHIIDKVRSLGPREHVIINKDDNMCAENDTTQYSKSLFHAKGKKESDFYDVKENKRCRNAFLYITG